VAYHKNQGSSLTCTACQSTSRQSLLLFYARQFEAHQACKLHAVTLGDSESHSRGCQTENIVLCLCCVCCLKPCGKLRPAWIPVHTSCASWSTEARGCQHSICTGFSVSRVYWRFNLPGSVSAL